MSKINITRAQFSTVPPSGDPIPVHFNPTSLQHTVSNTLEEDRQDHQQYVKKSSAKLTMDLIFDTTDKGEDVRITTKKIEYLMKPAANKQKKQVPPIVLFEWGVFKFQGLVESFRETIDYFSGDGVPLRASINLTLARQEKVFEDTGKGGGDGQKDSTDVKGRKLGGGSSAAPSTDAVDVPGGEEQNATDMAAMGGDPEAGRDLAAFNDEENMRFPSGPFTVDASIELGGAVAFASGGASLSLDAGFGVSAGAGFGAGVSGGAGFGVSAGASFSARGGIGVSGGASFGASARGGAGFGAGAGFSAGASFGAGAGFSARTGLSAGAGASFDARAGMSATAGGVAVAGVSFRAGASASMGASFGGSASAGVMASQGAFAGLRVQQTRTRRYALDSSRFIQQTESITVATDRGARFRLGGQATFEESTSLSTDVGVGASLRTRIRFEEE